jgi:hypothetical protein
MQNLKPIRQRKPALLITAEPMRQKKIFAARPTGDNAIFRKLEFDSAAAQEARV